MRILVTGASGFLGSWVCRVLSSNHQVIGLVRENSDIFNLSNIKDLVIKRTPASNWKNLIKEIKPDVILILHWDGVSNSSRNSEEQMLNILDFREFISAAKTAKVAKVIGFGSQAELGPVSEEIFDNQRDNPTTLYGKAKIECRNSGFELTKSSNTDFIWARIFSTYGPLDAENWLIPSAILSLNNSQRFKSTSGEQVWSFLHAYDFVTAVNLLIENDLKQKIFNLGDTTTHTLKDVLMKIQDLFNSVDLVDFGSIPYRTDQVMRLEPRCEGLIDLGWKPDVSLKDGLIQTVNWFTNQPESALVTKTKSPLYFDLPKRIERINN